jgi:hypothetical protein
MRLTERCHSVLNIYSEQNEHQQNVITCWIFTEEPYIGYIYAWCWRVNCWLFFWNFWIQQTPPSHPYGKKKSKIKKYSSYECKRGKITFDPYIISWIQTENIGGQRGTGGRAGRGAEGAEGQRGQRGGRGGEFISCINYMNPKWEYRGQRGQRGQKGGERGGEFISCINFKSQRSISILYRSDKST